MMDFEQWLQHNETSTFRMLVTGDRTSIQLPISNPDNFKILLLLWYIQPQNINKYREFIGFDRSIMPVVTIFRGLSETNDSNTIVQGHKEILDFSQDLSIKYCMVKANSTMKQGFYPASKVNMFYDRWHNFVNGRNEEAKKLQLKGMDVDQTANPWVYAHTQSIYISSTIEGAMFSLGLAAIVLFASTGNLLITIFAMCNLIGVCSCILGCCFIIGWELGSIEAICLTILVGLSVDYVVHLANAYTESHELTREKRTFSMLAEMGHTVIAGAVTSVGASLILFTCQIQFFSKFGFFMCLTCFFSIFWSLCLFTPLCILLGPEENSCQVCWKKTNSSSDQAQCHA